MIARVVAACFFTGASTTLAQFAAPVTPPTATKWMTRLEAFEFLTDCNNNGLADECDLDCMALGASCNQPGCGGSDDCDWTGGGANGIPDECDIADCSDNPNCDDCNLNSVPDGCDIAKMTSLDADGNGVPDECITNSPICGRSTLGICLPLFWTNEIAWQLDGGYPDNKDSVPDLVVTLAGLMFLNDSVEIDGLRITPSSLLSVTQTGILGDLTIVLPGPLPAVECASTVDGECRVAGSPKEWNARGLIPPPRLAVSGYLEIGDGRRVQTVGGVSAILNGGRISVSGSEFSEGTFESDLLFVEAEGTLELTGTGTVSINGTMRLDGTRADDCCPCDDLRGLIPPPKFRADQVTRTFINGNLELVQFADVFYSSANNLVLAGNFDSQARNPACFDWTLGGLTLTDPVGHSQVFEVAGIDLGQHIDGFGTAANSNFSMGRVEIASGANVTFGNNSANTAGQKPCQEALYVYELRIGSEATVTIDNCRVYYETLVNDGAAINQVGCGQLVNVHACDAVNEHEVCSDGNACTNDACMPANGRCTSAPLVALLHGDTDYTGAQSVVDVDDIVCVLDGFVGVHVDCPLERVDLRPCGALPLCTIGADCAQLAAGIGGHCVNGTCRCLSNADCETLYGPGVPCQSGRCRLIDMADIFEVLDVFSGTSSCPPYACAP